jgi:hypothetical protein
MTDHNKAIKVVFVAFPDGTNIWTDKDDNEYLADCIEAWKASLPQDQRDRYKEAGCGAVAGTLMMLERDYFHIGASSSFPWPESSDSNTPNAEAQVTPEQP